MLALFFGQFFHAGICRAQNEETDLLHLEGKEIHLGLKPLVHEVVKRNANAVKDYLEAQISKERIKVEEGVFEPVFKTSFSKEQNFLPNSTEDILTRMQPEYYEDVNLLNIAMEGRVWTGGVWDLKYIDRMRSSSTIRKFRNYNREYDKSVKLSIQQPILKDFGKRASRIRVDLATIESHIDQKKYEQKIMELVAVTVQLYWKLYGAQKICKSWEESLAIAEDSLKDRDVRAAGGRIPRTEYMETQSALSAVKGELYGATTKVVEAKNQLLTMLNMSATEYQDVKMIATDDPFGNYENIEDREEYVRLALLKWPEYEIAQKSLEKEKAQLKYARNQVFPRLNIVGSVSTNTLDRRYEDSLDNLLSEDFICWSAGIEFSTPFFDNIQARSNLSIARMRVKQAEVELDSLKKSLSNSVYSKIDALIGLQKQLKEYQIGLDIKKQLLEIEKAKLQSGRSNLKNLLSQEEEYVDTQRKTLSCIVNLKMAQTALQIVIGKILELYQIEVKETQ